MLFEKSYSPFEDYELSSISDNVAFDVDLGAEGQARENNLVLEVFVTETATSAGTPGLAVAVAKTGIADMYFSSSPALLADLGAGKTVFKIALPDDFQAGKVMLSVTNGPYTGGKVSAVIRPLSVA